MWKGESVEEAWDNEVAHRIADLKAGKTVTVSWEQLHRELLAMCKEKQTNQSNPL